jgi:4,5-DOPA dioxygenase extradiol
MLTPILFIGHGSPTNAIDNNEYTRTWKELGQQLPTPKSIVCISAHWQTVGTQITSLLRPQTIHDFSGFTRKLFETHYLANGNPELAKHIATTLDTENITLNTNRGLDHGAWSILRNMYPDADIPVLQLSLDQTKTPQEHYDLGKKLRFLREENTLIIGSGSIIHNLSKLDWTNSQISFNWAESALEKIKQLIASNDHQALINYPHLDDDVQLAIPTPEHFIPMLYILALKSESDKLSFFNDKIEMGAISMTSVICQ